jgi:hypothetical protein
MKVFDSADSWKMGRAPARVYYRVVVPVLEDGLVHIAGPWAVFDLETKSKPDTLTVPSAAGTVRETFEETLCGFATKMGEKHDRAAPGHVPTCVVCVASWLERAEDTVV